MPIDSNISVLATIKKAGLFNQEKSVKEVSDEAKRLTAEDKEWLAGRILIERPENVVRNADHSKA